MHLTHCYTAYLFALWLTLNCVGCGLKQGRINNTISTDSHHHERLVSLTDLEKLLPSAKDGSHFTVEGGVYNNIVISLKTKRNVVIEAKNSGEVIITGNSRISIIDSDSVTLKGFLFKDVTSKNLLVVSGSKHTKISDNYFVSCGSDRYGAQILLNNGSSHNTIKFNSFIQSRSMGIVISTRENGDQGNTDNRILNNLFYATPRVTDVYPGTNGNGLESIQVGQGVLGMNWEFRTHIYENIFRKIIGDGNEIISIKSSHNYIYRNAFLDNESGVTVRLGNNCEIYDNYLENTSKGIRVFGYGHVIRNNYIQGGTFSIQLPAAHYDRNDYSKGSGYFRQENVKILSNTIVNPRGEAILVGNNINEDDNRTLLANNLTIETNKIITQRGNYQKALEASYRTRGHSITNNVIMETGSKVEALKKLKDSNFKDYDIYPVDYKAIEAGVSWKN